MDSRKSCTHIEMSKPTFFPIRQKMENEKKASLKFIQPPDTDALQKEIIEANNAFEKLIAENNKKTAESTPPQPPIVRNIFHMGEVLAYLEELNAEKLKMPALK
jgi:hypothetical protein